MIPLEAEWRAYRYNKQRRPMLTLVKGGLTTVRRADQLPQPEERDLPETPYSVTWERAFEPSWRPADHAHRREHRQRISYINSSRATPDTEMQALMESRPHEEPMTSKEEFSPLREQLADAVDALPDRLRWIFEARHYRGLSVREVGREMSLSKSYVDRLFRQAVKELQTHLADLIEEQ